MRGLSERDLVDRFRAGDNPARAAVFEEVYRRLGSGLFSLCLRMLGNNADAEDAFQETSLGIYRALPAFRGDARLATWAYRIAVRTCLRRRAARRREPSELLNELASAKRQSAVEQRELATQLDRAIASLRPAYRAVFSLCCIEELNQGDVASILGLPEGTVWTHLHRARKELAARLGDVRELSAEPGA